MIERHLKTLFLVARDVEPVVHSRHAAAVVYKGKIISIGTNQNKTHPYAVKYQKNEMANTLHAEVDAIYKAKKRLKDHELKKATLIVVRAKTTVTRGSKEHDHFGFSKPCKGCTECIKDHGIGKVVYTDFSQVETMKYMTEIWK